VEIRFLGGIPNFNFIFAQDNEPVSRWKASLCSIYAGRRVIHVFYTLITEFQIGNPKLMTCYKWPHALKCIGLLMLEYLSFKQHRYVSLAARVEAP
jgi:hypothetical protein